MASLRVVFRHIHINMNHCYSTSPRPMGGLLLHRRATWRRRCNSVKPRACSDNHHRSYRVVLNKDERLGERVGHNNTTELGNSTTTIAAIVTSLGGPPAAVGIVRLSGPHAVSIAGRVFRPGRSTWRPTSHVVEYGVVFDSDGNVIDEVSTRNDGVVSLFVIMLWWKFQNWGFLLLLLIGFGGADASTEVVHSGGRG